MSSSSAFSLSSSSQKTLHSFILILSVVIRGILFYYEFDKSLEDEIHFSTPTTSFKRLKEGLFLSRIGQSPYSSSSFLQPPLTLAPFALADQLASTFSTHHERNLQLWMYRFIFIISDLVVAFFVYGIAKNSELLLQPFYKRVTTAGTSNTTTNRASRNLPQENTPSQNLPIFLMSLYLLNPVMIGSCVSMSTIVFNNLSIAGAIYFATKSNIVSSTLFLAFGSYLTLYPITLLVGIILIVRSLKLRRNEPANMFAISGKSIIMLLFWTCCLHYASISLLESIRGGDSLEAKTTIPTDTIIYPFLSSTLGTVIGIERLNILYEYCYQCYYYPFTLQDLTPNWGTMWYFFTEVFNDFKAFFLLIFHLHAFIYVIPLTLRFKNDGLFWCLIQTAIISVFKAYPCLGDFYFYMTLLLLFIHISQHMRYGFFIVSMLLASLFVGPICFNTWIHKGTGNANFFYFVTLIFLVGNILLIVEFVFARLKATHLYKKNQ
ncbi:hypothetical protein C9374_002928 [Naegleria lovaniensis]|uniref:GPI transamidase subunit PIG-U n=1 Tax=Naegleria lovaniensis TaxID=51637 RepID=A0AA88KLF1_NAELO|nr:uncharacterized protein C9374_002928 [Naegleria lovaniensis]KAG2385779.1 hypothetical protein C9374_002928 [Naegleria lovaniensis]